MRGREGVQGASVDLLGSGGEREASGGSVGGPAGADSFGSPAYLAHLVWEAGVLSICGGSVWGKEV